MKIHLLKRGLEVGQVGDVKAKKEALEMMKQKVSV